MEILVTIDMPSTNNVPVQISIVYDDDGEVASCDWRHAVPDIIECMEMEMDEYNSDEDPDWMPHPVDTETEDDEPLEYDSDTDDSTY
tara:strand:- start:2067 stop:2327 length:261 start_codon:yes stop_codon:yes gene_type:complete